MPCTLAALHVMTGYWGEVDALHTFCEPNYASSAFVAEFWNSLGSAVYCFAALSGLVSTVPSPLSSALTHATATLV